MRPITCALLDPDAEFCRRLREWLEGAGGIAVVGEAQDEWEALEMVAARRPHVLLADLDALGGPDGVARTAARFPETRLLILHRPEEGTNVLEALRRGAWGHVAKETPGPEKVMEAVRAVAQGDAYLGPTVAGRVLEEVARRLREQEGGRG